MPTRIICRISMVDITDEAAMSSFRNHTLAAWLSADEIFTYSKLRMNRAGDFDTIFRFRDFIQSLFEATSGKLIRQEFLARQFAMAVREITKTSRAWCEVEGATYRLRCMMAHCRQAALPPSKIFSAPYEALNGLLRCIDIELDSAPRGNSDMLQDVSAAVAVDRDNVDITVVSDDE